MADRETRKKQITADRQAQILEAAAEVFTQKGFAAATIPEIARKAGLAPGTIYLYFPSKRELFVKIVENFMVSPLLALFEKAGSEDFKSVLKIALDDRIAFLQSSFLNRIILLMSEIQRDQELKEYFYKVILQPLFERMGRVYGAQQSSGAFRRIDPEVVTRLIGGMMIGSAMLRNLEGQNSPLNKIPHERLVQEIMEFILYGVAGNPDAE